MKRQSFTISEKNFEALEKVDSNVSRALRKMIDLGASVDWPTVGAMERIADFYGLGGGDLLTRLAAVGLATLKAHERIDSVSEMPLITSTDLTARQIGETFEKMEYDRLASAKMAFLESQVKDFGPDVLNPMERAFFEKHKKASE